MGTIPEGMIYKTRRLHSGEGWYALVGWPTDKGNFGNVPGKWAGTGATEDEAIADAVARSRPRKIKFHTPQTIRPR